MADGEGLSAGKARAAVDAAIDRWVWYAGWTDKLAAVLGGANPVAGPYFDFSMPEPTGVVAVLAPQQSSLLGLVSVLAPVLAGGNTAVVVSSRQRPLPAVTLGEVLATSDVPAGVVNLLTGDSAELGPVAGRARRRRRHRPHRGAVGPRHGVRAVRGGDHQARRPARGDRTGLDGGSRPRPHDPVPGDEDGLAPDGRLICGAAPATGQDDPGRSARRNPSTSRCMRRPEPNSVSTRAPATKPTAA